VVQYCCILAMAWSLVIAAASVSLRRARVMSKVEQVRGQGLGWRFRCSAAGFYAAPCAGPEGCFVNVEAVFEEVVPYSGPGSCPG